MNLYHTVLNALDRTPDAPAVTYEGKTWTYAEFDRDIQRLSRGLHQHGIQPGSRVGLLLPNDPSFVFSYLATVRLGATAVPINFTVKELELAHMIADAEVDMVIALPTAASVCVTQPSRRKPLVVTSGEASDGMISLSSLFLDAGPVPPMYDAADSLAAAFVYTNAEDGFARGAVLSHTNIAINAHYSGHVLQLAPGDKNGAILPLFHTFGATCSMIASFDYGVELLLINRFKPKDICELIQTVRPTQFCAVPTMYASILATDKERAYDLSSVKVWISGGSRLTEHLQLAFEDRIGKEMRQGYGLTEAAPVAAANAWEYPKKLDSIGHVLPIFQGGIAGPDGALLPAGEIGELCVRGPCVFSGYLNDPQATRRVLNDGWLHTGDLGWTDADGDIHLTGRLRNMFIRAGLNIYPREVERLMLTNPDIASVRFESLPDELYGEQVKATVTGKPGVTLTEQQLIRFCRSVMAPYKVPKQFVIEG